MKGKKMAINVTVKFEDENGNEFTAQVVSQSNSWPAIAKACKAAGINPTK